MSDVLSRRWALKVPLLTAGGAIVGAGSTQAAEEFPRSGKIGNGPLFYNVETNAGTVQGLANSGTVSFLGIPYGADTGGRNRFMPPRKPAPWRGVRECFNFGQVCPQIPASLNDPRLQLMQQSILPGGYGENCLVLNVYTPGVNDNRKRPVVFAIHGGGYETGSGNHSVFDGGALCKFGDVVVVSVNHRLNVFGFLDLAAAGAPAEFKYSGVAGMMDIVAALEWVRDNIGNFGGDPGRVTIMGQSGGGGKVSILMAVPSARDLFHRAVAQSGVAVRVREPESAARTARNFMTHAGISDFRALQSAPWQVLAEAYATMPKSGSDYTPTVGTDFLPQHPFDPAAPAVSAHVPMIISNCLGDIGAMDYDLTDAQLKGYLGGIASGEEEKILALYRRTRGTKSPFRIRAEIQADTGLVQRVDVQAVRKAALKAAPVYRYQWDWGSRALDGRMGPIHHMDVPPSMAHPYHAMLGGGSDDAKAITEQMASVVVAFAKTGNPNNANIPNWPPFDGEGRATMIFDAETRLEHDPRSEIRKFWLERKRA